MTSSRLERKRESSRRFLRRLYMIISAVLTVITLIIAYNMSIFAFTILFIIMFFGIINLNLFSIRVLIPGITSGRLFIRLGAAIFYLVMVFILIVKVSAYSNK